AAQMTVEHATDHDADTHAGNRQQQVAAERRVQEADGCITSEPGDARNEEVPLQRGAKTLRRPTAQRSVHGERRPIHTVRTAEYSGDESGAKQQGQMIVLEMSDAFCRQRIRREYRDDDAEYRFDDVIIDECEERETKRNA